MRGMKAIVALLALILILPLASAQGQPFTQTETFDEGLTIEHGFLTHYVTNTTIAGNIHVFNTSNGVPIITGATCYYHLYNSTGQHIANIEESTVSESFDYEFEIDAANFTIGDYLWIAQCNNSVAGGFLSGTYEVTNSGQAPTTAHGIIYALLLLTFLVLALVCFYTSYLIDGRDTYSSGHLIEINYGKYLKPAMLIVGYIFLLLVMFFASEISVNFLQVETFSTMITVMNQLMWYLLAPIMILYGAYVFLQILADSKLTELKIRGLKPR